MQHIFTLWLLFTSMHVRCILHGPLMHGKLFTGILTLRIILISWRSLGVIVCSYTVWTELVLVFKALNPATCRPCDAGRFPKSNRPTSPGLKAIQRRQYTMCFKLHATDGPWICLERIHSYCQQSSLSAAVLICYIILR